MNRDSKRVSSREKQMARSRGMLASSHVLIAIVALIECLILISFTTYSWIESSSSLVIKNGPQTTVDDTIVNLDIADQLNYMVELEQDSQTLADLNQFFSKVKYYEFAKTTSPDGKTFFFPRRNNTYTGATTFRKGDTTDYNTSYYYFDFVMFNKTNSSKDIYFDEDFPNIFTVTDGDLDQTHLDALRSAMRVSITTQVGSGAESTYIYSVDGSTNISMNPAAPEFTDAALTNSVSTRKLSNYVYAERNGAIESSKLFSVGKSKQTKVSVRIWFELMDPTFQTVFGFDQTNHSFESADFGKIPSAKVGVNFALKLTNNDFQAVYFDDYTFSNQTGATHVTDENDGYSMWFHAYQPYTSYPTRTASEVSLQMTRDSSSGSYSRWYTGEATASMMTENANDVERPANGSGMSSANIGKAYFAYANGDPAQSGTTVKYKWTFSEAPSDVGDFIFDAYSVTTYRNNTSSASAATTTTPVGIWDDTENNTMALLQFKDMATAVTTADFNRAVTATSVENDETVVTVSVPNYQFMNFAAAANNHSSYLLYVNNANNATNANNYSAAVAQTTAAMYYDAAEKVFKSYVPRKWLVGGSGVTAGAYFSYCPSGVFGLYDTYARWFGSTPAARGNSYIYTALGYTDGFAPDYHNAKTTANSGVGTWTDVEIIHLSAELVDADHKAAYRYFVGVNGYSDSSGTNYYVMNPDPTGMTFSAYIPKDLGKSTAELFFKRYSDRKTGVSSHDSALTYVNWSSNARNNYKTFYPIEAVAGASNVAPSVGYWNLSVLIDGTYENIIYDTLTDDDYGLLQFSYDGETWNDAYIIADDSSDVMNNRIGATQTRWYAPAEDTNQSTVWWKWTPYAAVTVERTINGTTVRTDYPATIFTFTHNTVAQGIYKVITEASNSVESTVNTGDGTPSAGGSRIQLNLIEQLLERAAALENADKIEEITDETENTSEEETPSAGETEELTETDVTSSDVTDGPAYDEPEAPSNGEAQAPSSEDQTEEDVLSSGGASVSEEPSWTMDDPEFWYYYTGE